MTTNVGDLPEVKEILDAQAATLTATTEKLYNDRLLPLLADLLPYKGQYRITARSEVALVDDQIRTVIKLGLEFENKHPDSWDAATQYVSNMIFEGLLTRLGVLTDDD